MIFGFVGVFTFMYLLGLIDNGDGTDALSEAFQTLMALALVAVIICLFIAIDN